jgi:hypothetical protein
MPIVAWGLAVAAAVLTDQQVSANAALGDIPAMAVAPGFIGLCVIGLPRPFRSSWLCVDPGSADKSFDANASINS